MQKFYRTKIVKKVSVIIPVYNSEKYLSRCLDSIIAQTLNEIEIICVDNGSIDNSAELIKSYIARDSRIKLISTENHGPGAARNIGIKEATGEYLGFVDSDDWVDKDYYEKLYSVAKKYDVEISCCGLIREHKNRKKYRFNFKSEKIIENIYDKLKEMKVPDISYSVNKLYKKSFITKNNLLYPENVFFEDVPFMFKAIFYCDKIATVTDTFYHYFANPNSIVKTKSTKKAQ